MGSSTERAFKLGGYEVFLAQNGEDALTMLLSGNLIPDVIVMDVAMPKLGGLGLLKKIKQEVRLNTIPVAVLTNSFTPHTMEDFKEADADLYLVKMVHSPKEVVRKVDGLVQKI
jgi:CheY-like chemotaxis protein